MVYFIQLILMGELIFSIETSDDIMASPSILSAQDIPNDIFGNNDGDACFISRWDIC